MNNCGYWSTLLVVLAFVCTPLFAQDYGDAPSSYGLASANSSLNERLGIAWTNDTSNPVTPAWTGDTSDDGVSTSPTWNAGLSNNSVSVYVDTDNYTEYFTMWIDLNDDGDFTDTGERFDHPSFPTDVIGTYTFSNISIPAQNYTLNGTNKIAVRFILKYNSAITGPTDNPSYGEVEDYLFDVTPSSFTITSPATLPNAGYATSYSQTLQAVNGVGTVTWQQTGGNLPPGVTLSSAGVLNGTPTAAAAGNTYNFDVLATDSNSPPDTDTKSFSVTVDSMLISGNATLQSAIEGQSYSHTFTVTNGSTPYTWSEVGSNLPSGLSLTQNGDDFDLTGTPGTGTGGVNYNFTIEVSDGSVTEQRTFDLYVIGPPATLPYTDDFSTDKGWTLGSGQGVTWSLAPCGASYTPNYGNPEATTDHSPSSDNRILGDNIGAEYSNSMSGTVWAESPAVNCTNISDVELVFWRWLNVESPSYDHAYISVSPDNGQSWTQVWENTGAVSDTGWVEQKVNISSVAGNQAAVKVRFGIGATDSIWDYAGWCIDDMEIRELPSTTKLVLTDFEITSAYSVGSTNPSPKCYTGDQYTYDLTFDNTTANDIQVDSITYTVVEFGNTSPENVGTWQLSVTVPFTVPANTTGHTVSGTFDCTALSSSGANVALENTCEVQGTEQNTNKPVETELMESFYVDQGPPPPPPSMEVHEISYQGPSVDSGQAASGTNRDLGSQDIDSGSTSWVNIVILNNTGTTIDVDTPTLAGADAAHFRLDTSQWTSATMTLTTSGASSQIYFSVRFNPHELGQLDAQVEFTHTAVTPSANPFVVPLTGNGTGNAPEMQVHEIDYLGPQVSNGQSAANTNRDFGSVAAGGFSQWLNIVIWNRFATDTTIDPLPTLTGADAADFSIDTAAMNNPHTIPGDVDFTGTTYFSIQFAPQASSSQGVKTATVTFGHNASNPGTTPFTFEITGTVTASGPALSVYELDATGNPSFGISNGDAPANGRDFGSQIITAGATTFLEVEILNTGSSNLTLGTPTLTGNQPNDFVIDTTSYTPAFSTSVALASTTKFRVAFNPTATGTRNATVEFTHNGNNTATPFTFDVTGVGLPDAPIMDVYEGSGTGPAIAYNDPATGTGREFGSRDVNAGPSSTVTIYIENTGFQDLTLGTPTLTGSNPGEFTITAGSFPATVTPSNGVSFDIAFDPDTYGNKSAMVEFTHNDPQLTSPFTFEVTGFGDAPAIEVREGSITGPLLTSGAAPSGARDFGTVQLASMPSAPLTIVIVNAGNANLILQTPTITGPNSSDFTLTATGFPATVSAGNNVSFTVEFDAAQVGVKDATVNVGHNAGGTSPFTFDITGEAADPNGVRITSGATLPSGKGGQTYDVTLQATGGTTPYTWAIRSGSLPSGLNMSASGQITGQPANQAGNFTFEVRVTDAQGGTDDQTFTITVTTVGLGTGGGASGGGGGGGCAGSTGATPMWALLALMGLAGAYALRKRCRA